MKTPYDTINTTTIRTHIPVRDWTTGEIINGTHISKPLNWGMVKVAMLRNAMGLRKADNAMKSIFNTRPTAYNQDALRSIARDAYEELQRVRILGHSLELVLEDHSVSHASDPVSRAALKSIINDVMLANSTMSVAMEQLWSRLKINWTEADVVQAHELIERVIDEAMDIYDYLKEQTEEE